MDVDAVIVSYNSEDKLERCLTDLVAIDGVNAIVVDNASQDGSLAVASRFPVATIALDWNSGFAHGCNVGWRAGTAPFVLFVNPDAAIEADALALLVSRLAEDPGLGIVAPRVRNEDGSLAYSLRRFPTLRRAFSQAVFLHRLAPSADWADEVVRDPASYERPWSPDWVSGACLLVRRTLLETIGGWDERFFLYSEDVDLCRRARDAGAGIRYEPDAVCLHTGGASAPRGTVLPLMAHGRRLYAQKHERRLVAAAFDVGFAISSLTHAALTRDRDRRRGHVRAALAGVTRRGGAVAG